MAGANAFSRRDLLASAVVAGGALSFGPGFLKAALAAPAVAGESPYGPLQPPDALGLMLPEGFTGREIARGGSIVGGYPWHFASDGQATYRTQAGGHILVSNSEAPGVLGGGSSAIRFTPAGAVERAYRILAGTNLNCAGGPTPWGTWLSCEEHPGGMVWEADPAGVLPALPRPALGNFAHEAAAVDPADGRVYLTEDEGDGCFYRFTPDAPPSLLSGVLEVAVVAADGSVGWSEVPDPNLVLGLAFTREQVPEATRFDGGEGLWHHDGVIYFTTKGDRRVWAYDARAGVLDVLYDRAQAPGSALDAVDNVTVSASGDVYVCEDGGNMEIGVITPERVVAPFLRLTGPAHEQGSEMVGVVFDPSATRMYFGSQRAHPIVGETPAALGAIYEVTGPFRLPPGGVPEETVFGPPAGERLLSGLGDAVPGLAMRVTVLPGAVQAALVLAEPAELRAVLRTAELETAHSPRWREPRPVLTTLAERTIRAGAGPSLLTLRPDAPRPVRAILTVAARTRSSRRLVAARAVEVG